MKQSEFKNLTDEFIGRNRELLFHKNNAYNPDADCLSAFKETARLNNISPVQSNRYLASKHTISINQMVRRKAENPQWAPDKDYLFEKIGDEINYLYLLAALLLED